MKTALVTGGNRGIGLALVKKLCMEGFRTILGTRDLKNGKKALAAIGNPSSVDLMLVDLTKPEDFEEVAGSIKANYGTLDVLVNNAGINYDTWADTLDPDWKEVHKTLQVNTLGPWQLAVALLPLIPKGGRIVNLSSEAGSLASLGPGTPSYGVSKAALNAVTIKLAHACYPKGILVNAVCPGWVRTDMGGAEAPRSPAEGAESIYWAIDLQDDGPYAGFFRDGQRIPW